MKAVLKFFSYGKIFSLVILSLIFFSHPSSIKASDWEKYLYNPIFSPGAPGNWDSGNVQNSSIVYQNGTYKMWYAANGPQSWRIGSASSIDGVNWNKRPNFIESLLPTGEWDREANDPFVLFDENVYKMWYSSIGARWVSGPDRFRLKYATSLDGENWTKYPGWILTGTPGSWDSGGIARGLSVVKKDGNYLMWYSGVNEATMGTEGEEWLIGLATSTDGINWTKNSNPIIIPIEEWELNSVSYPHVIYENGKYHMWYASTSINLPSQILYAYSNDGINWTKPQDHNPALMLGISGSFDDYYIDGPFVIKKGDIYKMWYSGYDGSRWQIGYAESPAEPIPSPTPTETPTELDPLILIPGLGASWNYKSFLLNQNQPASEWRMTPGVNAYNNLIQAFENAGYVKGVDFFIFNYDWRQPVVNIAQELADFVNNTFTSGESIDLVGHSLGGLVGRTFAQNHAEIPIDQLITTGSPHQGVVLAYYLWEGGDLRQFSSWQRPLVSLLIHLQNPKSLTRTAAIREKAPVFQDLLPTNDYLKLDGVPKPASAMLEKNHWLFDLNQNFPESLLPVLNTISGNIADSTLRWIWVQEPDWTDRLLNLWPDGRPTNFEEEVNGDGTVLTESATLGMNVYQLNNVNHRDLVASPEGINQILEILGLEPEATLTVKNQIIAEESSLMFLASPSIGLSVYDEHGSPVGEGDTQTIMVMPAATGIYQVKIVSLNSGPYQIHIGQTTPSNDFWRTIAGRINLGEEKEFLIDFRTDDPLKNPVIDSAGHVFLESSLAKVEDLIYLIETTSPGISKKKLVLNRLQQIKKFISHRQIKKAIIQLYRLRWQISNQPEQIEARGLILSIINDLETVFAGTSKGLYPSKRLQQEISTATKYWQRLETTLKQLESDGQATSEQAIVFLLAQEKLNFAKENTGFEAYINALGSKYLLFEILRSLK